MISCRHGEDFGTKQVVSGISLHQSTLPRDGITPRLRWLFCVCRDVSRRYPGTQDRSENHVRCPRNGCLGVQRGYKDRTATRMRETRLYPNHKRHHEVHQLVLVRHIPLVLGTSDCTSTTIGRSAAWTVPLCRGNEMCPSYRLHRLSRRLELRSVVNFLLLMSGSKFASLREQIHWSPADIARTPFRIEEGCVRLVPPGTGHELGRHLVKSARLGHSRFQAEGVRGVQLEPRVGQQDRHDVMPAPPELSRLRAKPLVRRALLERSRAHLVRPLVLDVLEAATSLLRAAPLVPRVL